MCRAQVAGAPQDGPRQGGVSARAVEVVSIDLLFLLIVPASLLSLDAAFRRVGNYATRRVGEETVVVPIRSSAADLDSVYTLNAVGAVNRVATLCSEATRQNAPASGVPTGLPS